MVVCVQQLNLLVVGWQDTRTTSTAADAAAADRFSTDRHKSQPTETANKPSDIIWCWYGCQCCSSTRACRCCRPVYAAGELSHVVIDFCSVPYFTLPAGWADVHRWSRCSWPTAHPWSARRLTQSLGGLSKLQGRRPLKIS